MIRQFLCAGALVATTFLVSACSEEISSSSQDAAEAVTLQQPDLAGGEGPAIWQLADEDTTIHLFGTVHVLPPSLKWRTDKFNEIYSDADIVFFEADVSGQDAALARAVAKLGFMPVGEDLFALLSETQAEELSVAAAKLNLPDASLAKMKPWFAAMMIAMQAIMAEGQDPESGVEKILGPEAAQAGKDVRYFEEAEEQLAFMANLNNDVQVTMLMETARQIDDIGSSIIEMDNAWASGDVDRLAEIVASDPSMASQDLVEALLTRRNENWVSEINRLMNEETGAIFIAVGAAHLAGERSVLELLQQQGIETQRLQ